MFTGSTEVGLSIPQQTGAKPVSLEMGGNCPTIVSNHADVAKAAEVLATCGYYHSGQVCIATRRVYVHEDVYDEFLEKFLTFAKAWNPDAPFAEGALRGPQVSEQEMLKVLSCIELGQKEGATLVMGGKRVDRKGYFVE